LQVTGYPQIGGSILHISHLLPGSILMLVAILLMLSAINRSVRNLSAVLAGIGFGLVWDELGKFITNDNNYFFKPTVGLIYLSFVLLYLIARYIGKKRLTEYDYLANALDLLKEAAIKDLDSHEHEYAKELMGHVSKDHPLYGVTMDLLNKAEPTAKSNTPLVDKLVRMVRTPLIKLSKKEYFKVLVLSVSIVYGLASIGVVIFFFFGIYADHKFTISLFKSDDTNFIGGISALISSVYIFFGSFEYLKNRKHYAYRLFELAFLINIFVGQVILFFKNATIAILGLLITMILLFNVNILLAEEHYNKSSSKSN
jgi:hypothetical protein